MLHLMLKSVNQFNISIDQIHYFVLEQTRVVESQPVRRTLPMEQHKKYYKVTDAWEQVDRRDWLMLTVMFTALMLYIAFRFLLSTGYTLFDPDEAMSSIAGATFLHGGLPYVDVLVHRGPLLYLWHGVVLALFGPYSYAAVHWSALLYAIACSGYLLARVQLCFGRFTAAATSIALLILATVWVCDEDLWALNADFLMGATAAVGFACLLQPIRANPIGKTRLAVAGLLFGMAFTFKQSAFIFALVPGVIALTAPGLKIGDRIAGAVISGLAFLLPFVVFALHYSSLGYWNEFWEGFYVYNSQYATSNEGSIAVNMLFIMLPYGVFILFPAIAAARLWRTGHIHNLGVILIWLLTATLVATATSRSWANYLWPLNFAIAVVTGITFNWLWRSRSLPAGWRRGGALAVSVVFLALLGTRVLLGSMATVGKIDILATQTPKKVGGTATVIPDPAIVAKIIQTTAEYTTEKDTIFVMGGYAPEIHMLTKRPPASRFVTGNFVEQYYPGSFGPLTITAERRLELLKDIETTQPQLIFDPCELGYLCHDLDYVKELLQTYLDKYYIQISEGIYLRKSSPVLASGE